jgi:hypothetical protein
MATTTNYSWSTPDDTALVKDGAAAIRTLGSSVDTTVKALNPETTLGDLAYRSSTANVKTRLGLGTAGQVLQVNSGANAPEWATPSSGGITLISTQTPSNVVSFSFSTIPATYKNLMLFSKNVRTQFGGTNLDMRFNSDAATRYLRQNSNTAAGAAAFGADQIQLASNIDQGASTSFTITNIYDYANTVTWKLSNTWNATLDDNTPTSAYIMNSVGVYNQTGAISTITILCGGGGNIVSGTFELYGVK